MKKEKLYEQLAAIEHTRWSNWMNYLFSRCLENTDGSLTIINTDVLHWKRQIGTHYDHLSEQEKKSDREQVDRYWHLIGTDGFHSFDDLYDHRNTLFIALCRQISKEGTIFNRQNEIIKQIWRSKLHSDGTMFEDSFILGIGKETNKQISYHLDLNRWDECDFAETLETAPPYDGHTSADVLERLKNL